MESYPLLPLQRSMLLASLLTPKGGFNIEQAVLRFGRRLDAARIRDSWRIVQSRHSALRSEFEWPEGGEPSQRVAKDAPLEWSTLDWSREDAASLASLGSSLLRADRERGFDIGRAPLSRELLILLPDGTHALLWTFHHAILDGRSIEAVLREVLLVHDGLESGTSIELPDPVGFEGFFEWYRGRDEAPAREYWRGLLRGHEPSPLWPPKAAGVGGGHSAEERELVEVLDEAVLRPILDFAEASGVTLNTVLQAAWASVLGAYAGRQDILFGAVRASRHWGGGAHPREVGMFINTLPVRVRVDEDVPVLEWIRGLRAQHTAIRGFEHTPPESIARWVDWPTGQPLFEAGFHYDRASFTESLRKAVPTWPGIEVELHELTGMPLLLSCRGAEVLRVELQFDPALFSGAFARRMLGHFVATLGQVVRAPAISFRDLRPPRLPDERREPLPLELPAECTVHPSGTVVEAFERIVASQPERTAVEGETETLSYRELHRRAHRMARWLLREGIEPGAPIGLAAERSPWNLAGLLAILKAGACVLPLDPKLPENRRNFLLEDSGVRRVLCDDSMAMALAGAGVDRVVMTSPTAPWRLEGDEALPPPSPDGAAYLVYTSGTTGKPKGVVNLHRGLANEARCIAAFTGIRPEDRVLHMANLGFDTAFEEIFATLTSGGTLVLAPRDLLDSLAHFHASIGARRIHFLDLTTSFWAQWVAWMDRSGERPPECLKTVVVGGEKTQPGSYALWQEMTRGRVRWLNTYGPTEASIVSTLHESEDRPEHCIPLEEVPIGRPLPGTFVRILDARLLPVPQGVVGEIAIGGVGVARGYWNRPELTRGAFVPNPPDDPRGGTLYRSGDLARVTEDASLEYVGRGDGQVKIRGFRVEMGEVIAALTSHPQVAEAAVIPFVEGGRVSQLLAYVVPRGASAPNAKEIRAYLLGKLPSHACPNHVSFLEALPLTSHGKLDVRALPPPSTTESALEGGAPGTALERTLEGVFAEALGREHVGIDEDFFQAGGDSFAILELMEHAARVGVPLRPESVLRHPTVRALAAALEAPRAAAAAAGESGPIVTLRAEGTRPPLFLVHSTPGDVMGYGNLVHHLGSDQPCHGFVSRGLTDPSLSHRSIEDMASWYVEHLFRFAPGPYSLAGWCYGGVVAFEMARQILASGREVAYLGLIDAHAPPPAGALGSLRYYGRRLWHFLAMGPRKQLAYAVGKLARSRSAPTESPQAVDPRSPGGRRGSVSRENLAALRRYHPRPYAGPLEVYVSTLGWRCVIYDFEGGWPLLAPRAVAHSIDADHRGLLHEPAVAKIARLLEDGLARSQARVPAGGLVPVS